MRILILGATQPELALHAGELGATLRLPAISAGDLLPPRRLGTQVLSEEAVVDDILDTRLLERLALADCSAGFILAGYPRTLHQMGVLDFSLANDRVRVDRVLSLNAASLPTTPQSRSHTTKPAPTDTEVAAQRTRPAAQETGDVVIQAYRRRGIVTDIDMTGTTAELLHAVTRFLRARAAA